MNIAIATDRPAAAGARGIAGGDSPALDQAAFERLHGRTSQSLWSYLRRMTGDSSIADDVHQESYLRYLARPCPIDDERRQAAYLFRIASNLVRDRWRREKRRRSWLQQLLATEPVTETRLSMDFENVFQQLAHRQRALLWLAYVEGYQHQEIAEILDLKVASIKVMLFRARRRLAELLRAHGLDPETSKLTVSRADRLGGSETS